MTESHHNYDPSELHQQLKQQILEILNHPNYHPVKPRVLAKKLKLDEYETDELRRVVKRMIRSGELVWGQKHLLQLPAAEAAKGTTRSESAGQRLRKNELIGVYRRNSGGFGFVSPELAQAGDRSGDVFIPARAALSAMSGDVVRVRFSQRKHTSETRLNGRVVEVLKRGTHRFVGTYHEIDDLGYVTIDGQIVDFPVSVGDASAKNVREGDKVLIEMVEFPSGFQRGEAVVVEVFGPRGKPGVDTLLIINEFDLPGEFPESVLHDARDQASRFSDKAVPENRRDFTQTTIVTIDPATARDFDDAISLERLPNGNWSLGVHIADVSHFVPRGSELDREAFARGNSVYLPDRVIPMLPEIISNNLASLQPHKLRFAMSVVLEIDDNGLVIHTDWCRSAIRSEHRFNYEEVDDYLADDKPWRKKLSAPVFQLVRDMHTLAMTMRQRRMQRGAIDLLLPEVVIDLDSDGRVAGAHVSEYTESHQIIEEFMLAANVAVAEKLQQLGYDLLRRVHEAPSEKKLRELTQFVRHLGVKCDSLESRFEIKRVVSEALDLPHQQAIHFAVLRSMQKAVYSPREIGHYALAADAYCHFTSPIRRYPDLVVHRMVGDIIDGKKPQSNADHLAKIGNHCSQLERRAEQAERELTKLKLLNFLADRVGMKMEAFITGVESFGIFAQGVDLPAEGLISTENLPPDHYRYDNASRSLVGFRAGNEFRLGDRLTIVVHRVDPDRRQLIYRVEDINKQSRPKKKKSTKAIKPVKKSTRRPRKRE